MATVTIGSIDYTTYSDVAEADIYFNGSVCFSEWVALSDDAKGRGLIESTRLIDRQQWQGTKVLSSPEQELEFGRTGLTDCGGDVVSEDESLSLAIEASQLLALDVNTSKGVIDNNSTEDLTKRLKAGSVEIENFRADQRRYARFPVDVMELIGCFLAGNIAISGSIASGTDGKALDTDYERNFGL